MHKSIQKPCIQILDELIEALANFRLKLVGNAFFENVWAGDKSEIYLQSKAEFDNDCKHLRTLKDLANIIEPMNQCFNTKRKEMETALVRASCYYGLELLPNEIFMRIIDLLSPRCVIFRYRMKRVKNLSSVSRRFRDGVVDTASFWVYWDNEYCLDDGFEHRLSRTKEAPLFIDLYDVHTDFEKICTRILPHRSRWHHFRIILWNGNIPGGLGPKLPMVDFPSVRSLVIDTDISQLGENFLVTWTFPNASSVELWDIVAPPGAHPKATSFTLHKLNPMDDDDDDEERFLPKLTTLLRSMPVLTTLDLDVQIAEPSATAETLTVELPGITTFSIGNCYKKSRLASIECIGQVTRVLKVPNVENFALRLILQPMEEENWVSKIFNERVPFRAAKDFRISVASTTEENLILCFDGFSSRFPNLHSLRVDRFMGAYSGYGSFSLSELFDTFEGRLPNLNSLVVLTMGNNWSQFHKWFTSLTEKGATIDHLSVHEMQGLDDFELFIDRLKQNNADIKIKVIPRSRSL